MPCFWLPHPATTPIDTLSLHDALPISTPWVQPLPIMPIKRRVTSALNPAPTIAPKDRKSTRLNSSHVAISYAVFCLKKKSEHRHPRRVGSGHPRRRAARDPPPLPPPGV